MVEKKKQCKTIGQKVDEINTEIKDKTKITKDRTKKVVMDFDGYVKGNPYKSAGMAAGIGAIAGAIATALLRRKKKRE